MLRKLVLAVGALFLAAAPAHAFVIANLEKGAIDFNRPTHIFVSGYSHGQGNQFFKSPLARALRHHELYPQDQIVFVRPAEAGSGSDTKSFGINVIQDNSDQLTGARLVAFARKFSRIASFHTYSHSGAITGIGLEGSATEQRLQPSTQDVAKLKDNFVKGAYATLNGCNAGWQIAPAFSKMWGIPVTGGLTGTDFQALASDNGWYFNNAGQYPSGGFKSKNDVSYESDQNCKTGGCMRMKPTNSAYHGYWGDYAGGGLGFYKFFCNFDGDTSQNDECLKGMARAVMGFPSLRPVAAGQSLEHFKEIAQDWLCPIKVNTDLRAQCVKALQASEASGDEVFNGGFPGNPIECSLKGCNAKVICKYESGGEPIPGTCSIDAPKNSAPKTMVQEYKRLIEGYGKL